MDRNTLFGGNPVSVIIRLAVISIIVGVVLSALNIQPDQIIYHIQRLIRHISDLGFGAVESVFRWFLIGAVVVIPIWLIARVLGLLSRKEGDGRR
jgi:hypothetical protein